jgi:xylulokinase
LTTAAAEQLGLEPGTAVFNGYGDLPAIMVGTGSGLPGRAHIYLGSSSWFVVATESRPQDAPLSFSVSEHLHGAAYVIQSGCLAYDWAVAQLYRKEGEELGKGVNALVNREVAEVGAGSGNLLATHWINGELPPLSKNSRGLFLNLTALHDRRHMVRAVMESICYAHRASYQDYLSKGGAPLDRVRVVGGGATSDVWMQMLADVLYIPVEVPASPQSTGALGAYFAAQVGRGRLASFADIDETVVIERRFEPDPKAFATYARLFAIHARLHESLRDIFTALNGEY